MRSFCSYQHFWPCYLNLWPVSLKTFTFVWTLEPLIFKGRAFILQIYIPCNGALPFIHICLTFRPWHWPSLAYDLHLHICKLEKLKKNLPFDREDKLLVQNHDSHCTPQQLDPDNKGPQFSEFAFSGNFATIQLQQIYFRNISLLIWLGRDRDRRGWVGAAQDR